MGLLIYNFIQTNKLYSQAMFTLYRKAFAPPRKSSRIELLFTHKNGSGGAISVTDRSCAAPISKVESEISKRSSHYRTAFAPPRKSYRIGLLFTHKNRCGGAISVTKQSCTASISKVESHISKRCSHYNGQLLRRHEDHIGLGFCSHKNCCGGAFSVY